MCSINKYHIGDNVSTCYFCMAELITALRNCEKSGELSHILQVTDVLIKQDMYELAIKYLVDRAREFGFTL